MDLYYFFVSLRFFFIFTFGYIHADEFFQGPTVFSKDIFGINSTIPWEFTSNDPIRTITTPYQFIFE